jgi:hypothetical protein
MLKLANSIHTRGKLVQIVLTFLIIGTTVIWCHSFTKLTGVGGKSTAGLFLNVLLCFVSFYLLFYSSYIIRRRLQTTRQTNSSTITSIAPEVARTTTIFGSKLGYVKLDVDVSIYVICVDVLYGYECDVVYRYNVMNYTVYEYDMINNIMYGCDEVLCMDVIKYCGCFFRF